MTRRLFAFLLVAIMATAFCHARTFVLITGVSNYSHLEEKLGLEESINLGQSTKDAKALADLWKTQTKDVTLLTSNYANRDNILSKLRAIANRAQKDDRIVFYFAGHGAKGFILSSSGPIPYKELLAVMDRSEASEKFIIIDACQSGSIADELIETPGGKPKARPDYAIFVASRAEETAGESSYIGQGFFTQALMKGMRGKGDYDSSRTVTVKELFKYIYADVMRRTKENSSQQHPQLIAPPAMMNAVVSDWTANSSTKQ